MFFPPPSQFLSFFFLFFPRANFAPVHLFFFLLYALLFLPLLLLFFFFFLFYRDLLLLSKSLNSFHLFGRPAIYLSFLHLALCTVSHVPALRFTLNIASNRFVLRVYIDHFIIESSRRIQRNLCCCFFFSPSNLHPPLFPVVAAGHPGPEVKHRRGSCKPHVGGLSTDPGRDELHLHGVVNSPPGEKPSHCPARP